MKSVKQQLAEFRELEKRKQDYASYIVRREQTSADAPLIVTNPQRALEIAAMRKNAEEERGAEAKFQHEQKVMLRRIPEEESAGRSRFALWQQRREELKNALRSSMQKEPWQGIKWYSEKERER
uniref:Exportin family protein n=1 Tax=Roseihalotalea indica TaxID=2867963 RepID=A0AA49GKR5_9BACT|nr:exportin family protein [Tunicatimonas sp. TK19036]